MNTPITPILEGYDTCERCAVAPGHALHETLEDLLRRPLVAGEVQHLVTATCKASGRHIGSSPDEVTR